MDVAFDSDSIVSSMHETLGAIIGIKVRTKLENLNIKWKGGRKTQLKSLAAITAPAPGRLILKPWDRNVANAIVKAINSEFGFNSTLDGCVIQVEYSVSVEEIMVELKNHRRSPLKYLASITVPAPDQLVLMPWDRDVAYEIIKAISSQLGISPTWNGNEIRVNLPTIAKAKKEVQAGSGEFSCINEAIKRATKSVVESLKFITETTAVEQAMGKLEAEVIAAGKKLCANNALESWFSQYLHELPKEVWQCDETPVQSAMGQKQQPKGTQPSQQDLELEDDLKLDDSFVVSSSSASDLKRFWPGKTAQYWIPSRQKPLCEMLSLLLQDNPDIQPSDHVPLLFHHGSPDDEPMLLDFSDEENPLLRHCEQSAEYELWRHEQPSNEKSGGNNECKLDRRMLVVSSAIVPEEQLVVLLMGKADIGLMHTLEELSWTLKVLPCDNQRVVFWEEVNTLTNMRVSPVLEKLADEGRLHIVLCKEQLEIMPGDKHTAEEALPIMFQKQAETLCPEAWRHWLPDAPKENATFVKQMFALEDEAGLALLKGIKPKPIEPSFCQRFKVSQQELTTEMVLELKLAYLEQLPSILSGRREMSKASSNSFSNCPRPAKNGSESSGKADYNPFPYNSIPSKQDNVAYGLNNSALDENWQKHKEKLGIALGKIVFRFYSDQKDCLPDQEEARQLFICFLALFSYEFAENILGIYETLMSCLIEVRNNSEISRTLSKRAILRFKPDFTVWIHKQFTCFGQRILRLQTILCGKPNKAHPYQSSNKCNTTLGHTTKRTSSQSQCEFRAAISSRPSRRAQSPRSRNASQKHKGR